MANYTNAEMAEMVFMYVKAEGNAREVQPLYNSLFQQLANKNGKFLDAEPTILDMVGEEPGMSIRRLGTG